MQFFCLLIQNKTNKLNNIKEGRCNLSLFYTGWFLNDFECYAHITIVCTHIKDIIMINENFFFSIVSFFNVEKSKFVTFDVYCMVLKLCNK